MWSSPGFINKKKVILVDRERVRPRRARQAPALLHRVGAGPGGRLCHHARVHRCPEPLPADEDRRPADRYLAWYPAAQTCFNTLRLPRYESEQQTREQIVTTMTEAAGLDEGAVAE